MGPFKNKVHLLPVDYAFPLPPFENIIHIQVVQNFTPSTLNSKCLERERDLNEMVLMTRGQWDYK